MVQTITVVSTKGQIVLPKMFREEYGLQPGQRVAIREDGGKLVVERVQKVSIDDMRLLARKYGKQKAYSSKEYEDAMEGGI